jgi:hypothetical protein
MVGGWCGIGIGLMNLKCQQLQKNGVFNDKSNLTKESSRAKKIKSTVAIQKNKATKDK